MTSSSTSQAQPLSRVRTATATAAPRPSASRLDAWRADEMHGVYQEACSRFSRPCAQLAMALVPTILSTSSASPSALASSSSPSSSERARSRCLVLASPERQRVSSVACTSACVCLGATSCGRGGRSVGSRRASDGDTTAAWWCGSVVGVGVGGSREGVRPRERRGKWLGNTRV